MSFLQGLKRRVMRRSRARKLDHFYSLYSGGTLLDAGVSSNEWDPSINLLLNTFRYPGDLYTGLGVQSLTDLATKHPDKRFVQYAGGRFPFPDKHFDWVHSNAVIEHVGDADAQLEFLNEMLRVARRVFFTTPNRYFPIEAHTNVFLLHWLPGNWFYRWCETSGTKWNRGNLALLSDSEVQQLVRRSTATTYRIFRNRLFGWPLTFTVVCESSVGP